MPRVLGSIAASNRMKKGSEDCWARARTGRPHVGEGLCRARDSAEPILQRARRAASDREQRRHATTPALSLDLVDQCADRPEAGEAAVIRSRYAKPTESGSAPVEPPAAAEKMSGFRIGAARCTAGPIRGSGCLLPSMQKSRPSDQPHPCATACSAAPSPRRVDHLADGGVPGVAVEVVPGADHRVRRNGTRRARTPAGRSRLPVRCGACRRGSGSRISDRLAGRRSSASRHQVFAHDIAIDQGRGAACAEDRRSWRCLEFRIAADTLSSVSKQVQMPLCR